MSHDFMSYLVRGAKAALRNALTQAHTPEPISDDDYLLGLESKEGRGTERNLRDAYLFFRDASYNGHIKATVELAECYKSGKGCEKNTQKMEELLQKAAEQGNGEAALKLGNHYEEEGKGDLAVKYFWIASDYGESEATSKLVDFYRSGRYVDPDGRESERLFNLVCDKVEFTRSGDGLYWAPDLKAKKLYIVGVGEMHNYTLSTEKKTPWFLLRDSISDLSISEAITSVGSYAFEGFHLVKSVVIPESVVTISEGAFSGCSCLLSVTIPKRVLYIHRKAFDGCMSLNSYIVSDENENYSSADGVLLDKDKNCVVLCPVNKVGGYAIPSTIYTIGERAFCECKSLETLVIPKTVTAVEQWAFAWCYNITSVSIQAWFTVIEVGLFAGCTNLTSITIPSSVTTINDCAFLRCSSLRTINFPKNIASIGKMAFACCYGLTLLNFQYGLASIDDLAFANCYRLTEVLIPQTTQVSKTAFIGCSNITKSNYPLETHHLQRLE